MAYALKRVLRPAAGALLILLCAQTGLFAQRVVHAPVRIAPVVPSLGGAVRSGAALAQPLLQPAAPSALSSALRQPLALPGVRTAVPRLTPSLKTSVPSNTEAVSPSRPLRLLIAGAPGSGKTTFGKMLARETGMAHISVGALLREVAKTHPEVAEVMQRGELVDSGFVLDLVRRRLSREDVRERGFILDGFPRRMVEARALQEWLAEGPGLDAMILLEKVSDVERRRRLFARGRKDDTEEAYIDRMKVHDEQTMPVIEYFTERLDILRPDVSGTEIEENYGRLKRSLDEWREHRSEADHR